MRLHEDGGVRIDRLVKSPLQKYAHLTGRDGHLTTHPTNAFHEDCEHKARELNARMRSDVTQQLRSSFSLQHEQNRSALKRILQAIEFLGRLCLPLRAHRDSGALQLPGNTIEAGSHIFYTEGNIRAPLQSMITCDDDIFRHHLMNTARNATYLSPVILVLPHMSTARHMSRIFVCQSLHQFHQFARQSFCCMKHLFHPFARQSL